MKKNIFLIVMISALLLPGCSQKQNQDSETSKNDGNFERRFTGRTFTCISHHKWT